MLYGRSKKVSCCYQCTRRVVGCHAKCKDHIAETEKRIAEKIAIKKFLYPAGASYFKSPEKTAASASQSKKRYK